MEDKTKQLVLAYVAKHYDKIFGNSTPIIKEFNNHFQISKLEDSSPLILGKGIINN